MGDVFILNKTITYLFCITY